MESSSISPIGRLLPEIKMLQRAEKLFILQFLVSELAQQEGASLLPELQYPAWSPHQAYEAADVLLRLLNEPDTKG